VEAERRQVTVLFTDMVDFTAYSEREGEEAAFTLMRSLSKLMDDAVRERGGVVQSFTGDGIMAVFGAPVAFEDAPLRACRAALAILQRLKAAGDDLKAKHGVSPRLRIGLNTGIAVVGTVQSGADAGVTVLGDTVNVAARLQALAAPDTVFMSEAITRAVQGMVETSPSGEHRLKGKSEPQKVYRLDSIRPGATRFDAALTRGLSPYVGRERELEMLERGLIEARERLCVIDVVAEPGMGKSRLLHELRQRLGKDQAFILVGGCSPDGQGTPFLPFIEIVRSSFQVSIGEAESAVAAKLDKGLSALGLKTDENLGLLLNLLGLRPPERALAGLDGVLIGLRTRDLLQKLLEARCRISPTALFIEDLHWIDSVSEEALKRIVCSDANLRLLLIHTRRPEYDPPWRDVPQVKTLHLDPLPAAHIRRLIHARLGVETLPEALGRQVTEKAEGNALFAEEIATYLAERGIIQVGRTEYDANSVETALPTSIQSLLTARIDRLPAQDRELLQAAAAIGRRFDPGLLAAVVDAGDVNARLKALRALDLIHAEAGTSDFVFKHALVREAIYKSLLTRPRSLLHLRIAEEIERRSSNRLAEVVETLALHFSQTDRSDKAFEYLALAGAKCLRAYSFEEAQGCYSRAIGLVESRPDCASDLQVAQLIADFALFSNLCMRFKATSATIEKFLDRIDRAGNSGERVIAYHHYIVALIFLMRWREADGVRSDLTAIAAKLADSRSKAYELASRICLSITTFSVPCRYVRGVELRGYFGGFSDGRRLYTILCPIYRRMGGVSSRTCR
jgi:class 3 adenylate cyclase